MKLAKEIVRLPGELNGEKYWIEVSDTSTNAVLRDALNKNTQEPVLLTNELARRIVAWDWYLLEDGDLPPTPENMATLPDEMITSLVETIGSAWIDGKKQKASAAGSGQAES